jgi:hypothetical protein
LLNRRFHNLGGIGGRKPRSFSITWIAFRGAATMSSELDGDQHRLMELHPGNIASLTRVSPRLLNSG